MIHAPTATPAHPPVHAATAGNGRGGGAVVQQLIGAEERSNDALLIQYEEGPIGFIRRRVLMAKV